MIKLPNAITSLETVVNRLYPDIECEVEFVTGLIKKTKAYGETCFLNDGSIPVIQVDINIPFEGFIEVVGHEIAHVIAGTKAEHNKEWKKIFKRIGEETMKQFNTDYAELSARKGGAE